MSKIVIALVIAAGVVLGPPVAVAETPAVTRFCPIPPMGTDNAHGEDCAAVPVRAYPSDARPDCPPPCYFATDSGVPAGTKAFPVIDAGLGTGMRLLGEAAVSRDPEQVQKLRDEALASFAEAAAELGDVKLLRPVVGFLDPRTDKFEPDPNPWRQAVGDHVTSGLRLLQQRLAERAVEEFDAAYTLLWEHAVPGN